MDKMNSNVDIFSIKKELADQLLCYLREFGELGFEYLQDFGYSKDAVVDMVFDYKRTSGVDIINCNNSLKMLKKSKYLEQHYNKL